MPKIRCTTILENKMQCPRAAEFKPVFMTEPMKHVKCMLHYKLLPKAQQKDYKEFENKED